MQDSNAVVKKIYCVVVNGEVQEKLDFDNIEIAMIITGSTKIIKSTTSKIFPHIGNFSPSENPPKRDSIIR